MELGVKISPGTLGKIGSSNLAKLMPFMGFPISPMLFQQSHLVENPEPFIMGEIGKNS